MRAALLLRCEDRPGIVAAVGGFVADAAGNIVEADQHSDPAAGLFLQRVEFDVENGLADLRRDVRTDRGALRNELAGPRPRDTGAHRGAGVAPGPLPRRPPGAQSTRGAPRRHRARRVESRDARRVGGAVRARLPSRSRRRRPRRAGARTRADDRWRRARCRRVGSVHARPPAVAGGAVAQPHDQHPPLVPAVVRRCAAIPPGARTRRQGDRCDRALRDAGTRRRADHRPAGATGLAPRRPRRASSGGVAISKRSCSPRRCGSISSTA